MYADVSLPIPLDQVFTYRLPETLWHRAQAGCRLIVPFGSRKLTGVVVEVHDRQPEGPTREALRLLDERPALEAHLLELFMRNPRQVLPRSLIYERVWGYDFSHSSNALDVYVGYLRRKTESESDMRLIHTVRGTGYVLREP